MVLLFLKFILLNWSYLGNWHVWPLWDLRCNVFRKR